MSLQEAFSASEKCKILEVFAPKPSGQPTNIVLGAQVEILHREGGPSLEMRLPEIRYEHPPFLVSVDQTIQPVRGPSFLKWAVPQPKPFEIPKSEVSMRDLQTYLENSPRFRSQKFVLEPKSVGGMATVFKMRFLDDREPLVIKVFNPSRPYFSGDYAHSELRRRKGEAELQRFLQHDSIKELRSEPKSIAEWDTLLAAMIQRQVGLQTFLKEAFRRHEQKVPADKGRFSVAEIDEDPYFLKAGIFVQPLVTGRVAEVEEVDPTARAMVKVLAPYGESLRRATDKEYGARNVAKSVAPGGIDFGFDSFENIRVYDTGSDKDRPRAVFIDW